MLTQDQIKSGWPHPSMVVVEHHLYLGLSLEGRRRPADLTSSTLSQPEVPPTNGRSEGMCRSRYAQLSEVNYLIALQLGIHAVTVDETGGREDETPRLDLRPHSVCDRQYILFNHPPHGSPHGPVQQTPDSLLSRTERFNKAIGNLPSQIINHVTTQPLSVDGLKNSSIASWFPRRQGGEQMINLTYFCT